MGNVNPVDPFDRCAGSTDGGKYKRPPPLPMHRTSLETKPETTYITRFMRWWFGLMGVISILFLVVKGIVLIAGTLGPGIAAIVLVVVVCAAIAAIAAAQ